MTKSYEDVLTENASESLREEMLTAMLSRMSSSREAYNAMIDSFLSAAESHLRKQSRFKLDFVPPSVYTNPEAYWLVRFGTSLWSYEQTGAQLAEEIEEGTKELPDGCTIAGVRTEFIGSRIIILEVHFKLPLIKL